MNAAPISTPGNSVGANSGYTATIGGTPSAGSVGIGWRNIAPGVNSDAGWYLDPVPGDSSEFNGKLNDAFSESPTAALGGGDLFTAVEHELGHCFGLVAAGKVLAMSTNTLVVDTLDAPASTPASTYWLFSGPSVKTLWTSWDSGGAGGGSTSRNGPQHAAPAGAAVNVGGTIYYGAVDLMNAYFTSRSIISDDDALMLHDAYGYSITNPSYFGTMYDTLDANGTLRITCPSQTIGDAVNISTFGETIFVSMKLGNPVNGSDPIGYFTSAFSASNVSTIQIVTAGGGSSVDVYDTQGLLAGTKINITSNGEDHIQIEDLEAGTSASITSTDDDTIDLGDDIAGIPSIQGAVTIAGSGLDALRVYDQNDTSPGVTWTITGSHISNNYRGSGAINYTGISLVTLNGGSGAATNYDVQSTTADTVVHAGTGAGTVVIGNAGSVQNILRSVSIDDVPELVTIVVDDSADSSIRNPIIGTSPADPNSGYISGLAPAQINYKYSDTRNITINTGTNAGNIIGVWEDGVTTNLVSQATATVDIGDGLVGVQSILGTLNISNPPRLTTINIDDSADPSAVSTTIGTSPTDSRWGYITGLASANINYKYADTASVSINGSKISGNVIGVWEDGVTINLMSHASTTVNIGDGLVGAQSILGTLNIQNREAFTSIYIDDSADQFVRTTTMGTFTPSGDSSWGYIDGLAPVSINYKYADTRGVALNLNSASGNIVSVFEGGTPITVATHRSTTVNIGDTVLGARSIVGTVNITGSGLDTLNVNDQGDTAANLTWYITASSIYSSADANGAINYTGLDLVNFNGGGGANITDNVMGTSVDTMLNAGSGTGTITVGLTGMNLDSLVGPLTIHGGGAKSLVIDDQNANLVFPILTSDTLAAGSLNRLTEAFNPVTSITTVRSITITYSGLASLTLNTGFTPNIVHVESTAVATTVNAGSGNALVDVSPTAANLDTLVGPLTVHGGSGTTLLIDDQNNTVSKTYTVNDGIFQRTGLGSINSSGLSALVVNGSRGTDTFNVLATSAATLVTINGGGGTDALIMGVAGGHFNLLQGPVTYKGGAGKDKITVNDQTGAREFNVHGHPHNGRGHRWRIRGAHLFGRRGLDHKRDQPG